MDGNQQGGGTLLDETLRPHGRMNFTEDCAVGPDLARLSMNDRSVFLAVARAGQPYVVQAPFMAVNSVGSGPVRAVTFEGSTVEVTFAGDAPASRFDRVLGVRKEATTVRRASVSEQRVSVGYQQGLGGAPRGTYSQQQVVSQYRSALDWASWSSNVLLALAFLDLVVGLIFTVVVFAGSTAAAGLITLFVTVSGFAVPLCLGSVGRLVVLRCRLSDAQSG